MGEKRLRISEQKNERVRESSEQASEWMIKSIKFKIYMITNTQKILHVVQS